VADDSYLVTRLDAIEPVPGLDPAEAVWKPIRAYFGITSFGTNAWVATEAGQCIVEEHSEDGDEELYVVLRGQADFVVAGEHIDAPAGTFVYVRPAAVRTAFAKEPGTAVLAVGATPGETFEPRAWELRYTAPK
jgi:mannose-6-phosphate isomerase-like protein (cupin superfamily)